MKTFRARTALALMLTLGAMIATQGCSDRAKVKEEPVAPLSQAEADKIVALAKQKLDRLRFNIMISSQTRVEVVGAKPTPVPGIVDLNLRVTLGDRTALRHVLVTSDLQHVIIGQMFRLGEIPRPRVDLSNVDLKDAPVKGDPKAPVTIVEYSDFQCPYCRVSQETVNKLLLEYDGKVKVVYRHYPLPSHAWAGDAALLSECARRQKPELFWKLHDFYYAAPRTMTRDNILAATQAQVKADGIDLDRLNKCYLEKEAAPAVKKSMDEGHSIGVRGTPVFLVNDVFLSGSASYPIMNAIILEELGRDWTKEQPAAKKN